VTHLQRKYGAEVESRVVREEHVSLSAAARAARPGDVALRCKGMTGANDWPDNPSTRPHERAQDVLCSFPALAASAWLET